MLERVLNFNFSFIVRNHHSIFKYFFFFYFLFRAEIKTFRQGVSPNQEKLTTWLSSSISELRTEISELQESASNLSRTCHQSNLLTEDLQNIHNEVKTFRLEINALKSRQEKSEVLLRELREEITENTRKYWTHQEQGTKKVRVEVCY